MKKIKAHCKVRPKFTSSLLLQILVMLMFFGFSKANALNITWQGAKVTLHLESIRVNKLLDILEDSTDYRFIYKVSDVDLDREVSVNAQDEPIENVLKEIFKGTNTVFRIVENRVYLAQSKNPNDQSLNKALAIVISGKVRDTENVPLPGASVLQKGTTNGVITDAEGNYQLTVPVDSFTVRVSFVGYTTLERTITASSSRLDFVLSEESLGLEDVVVIGYGTNSKEKITGAVSSVDASVIEQYTSTSVDQAIVGRVAGVDILTNARNPGDGNTITIRGAGSITRETNPLVVVDGFPLAEGSSLNIINTNDIERVDVLKDAASTAIYGSRAANGLIMITTKKGKKRGPTINFSSVFGMQERSGSYDLLNAYDAAKFFTDGRNNAYLKNHPDADVNDTEAERLAKGANVRELLLDYTLPYLNGEQGLTDFDWEDAVYRTGNIQNHYLNISGANDGTDYSVSLGYSDEEGIVITADQKRYTLNLKTNTDISDQVRFGVNVNGMYAERGLTNGSNNYRFPIDPAGRAMVYMFPFFSAYDAENGTAHGYSVEEQILANRPYNANMQENPVAMAELSKYKREEFNTFGNAYVEFEPINNLKLKSSLGYLYNNKFTDQFAPMLTGSYRRLISERDTRQGSESRNDRLDVLWENTLDYKFDIKEHSFNVLLGQSYQSSAYKSLSVTGADFPNDIIQNIDGSTIQTADASRSKWVQISYFSRLLYNFKNTYFLTGSIRTDGSSRFGEDNRFGTFGSFSAGWVFTNESFFPQNDILTFGKLRYSWGTTGNNQIGNYAQYASIGTGRDYPFNGTLHPGASPSSAPSPGLTWETNTSHNFGVDFSIYDVLDVEVNHYIANISNLLLDRPVPTHTGFSSSLQNVGEMENKGWEFILNTAGLKVGELEIGLNANLSTNQNEIISLGGAEELYEGGSQRFITQVGGSLANLYGYKIIGLLKSQEEVDEYLSRKSTTLSAEVGDYIFQDTDGNDVINADDRVSLGDYNAEVSYGFGLDLAYKGFDFNMTFNGTLGRVAFDEMTSRYLEYGEAFSNTNYHYFNNYWDPVTNPDGFLAAPDAYGNTETRQASRNPTNYNVLDADYFRIRGLQVGYTFPVNLLDRVGLKQARIYFSVNNLHTWTDYRGMNPDGGDNGNPLNRGHIHGTTSVPRIYSTGINLTF